MCSYYRRYIPGYAKLMKPILELLKKGVDIIWTPECEEVFVKVKKILTSKPVLALPNSVDPFILALDFSYDGMGMVLS